MLTLRPAGADDAEDVGRIYIDSWNDGFGHLLGYRDHDPERTERWRHDLVGTDLMDDAVRWTVAEVDGEIAGFVGVGASRDPIDERIGELHAIAVNPGHWRRGVGSALMSRATEQLAADWDRAILWTPANYDRGHGFYRFMGWQPVGWSRALGSEVAFARMV